MSIWRKEREQIIELYYLDPVEFTKLMDNDEVHELGKIARINNLTYCNSRTLKKHVKMYSSFLPLWAMYNIESDISEILNICRVRLIIMLRSRDHLDKLDKVKPKLKLDIEKNQYDILYSKLISIYYSTRTGII